LLRDCCSGRQTAYRPRGEFASWRAAGAFGDYDLHTLVIRADLAGSAEAIQPAMTLWLHC